MSWHFYYEKTVKKNKKNKRICNITLNMHRNSKTKEKNLRKRFASRQSRCITLLTCAMHFFIVINFFIPFCMVTSFVGMNSNAITN